MLPNCLEQITDKINAAIQNVMLRSSLTSHCFKLSYITLLPHLRFTSKPFFTKSAISRKAVARLHLVMPTYLRVVRPLRSHRGRRLQAIDYFARSLTAENCCEFAFGQTVAMVDSTFRTAHSNLQNHSHSISVPPFGTSQNIIIRFSLRHDLR